MFLIKPRLTKNDKKFSAKLLFNDVSPDQWDQENLTKKKLDFTIDSVRIVNEYADRLRQTDAGIKLFKEHKDNFTNRIGAYLGEVIKNNTIAQYHWYDFHSIRENTAHLKYAVTSVKDDAVLYSKKLDKVLCPIYEAKQYLEGKSNYNSLLTYVEEAIKN